MYKQATGLQFLCNKSDQLIYHLVDYNSNIKDTKHMHIKI